jgi:hypothetical protein
MNLIPKSLFEQFEANGCVWNVAKPANNPPICNQLDANVTLLIMGLNPYDLFRRTYGMGVSQQKKEFFTHRLEDSHGTTDVGGEIKHYKRGVSLEQYTPWIKKNPLLHKLSAGIFFGDALGDYLNRADVRAALHIPL